MTVADHNALWARERRRRTTLLHMGVDPLVSRFDPEGARSQNRLQPPRPAIPATVARTGLSGAVAGDQQGSPAVNPGAVRQAGTVARGASGGKAAAPKHAAVGKDADVQPVADPVGGSSAAMVGGSVTFQLMIVSAGAWLWLEELDDALIRREQLQLVQGMARSITEGELMMSHLQFDWPLASHAHLPRDADAARESVSGQLRRLARERQARGFILMGSGCKEWVRVPPALTRLEIPSTLAMLADPALKRDAWRILQPQSL